MQQAYEICIFWNANVKDGYMELKGQNESRNNVMLKDWYWRYVEHPFVRKLIKVFLCFTILMERMEEKEEKIQLNREVDTCNWPQVVSKVCVRLNLFV